MNKHTQKKAATPSNKTQQGVDKQPREEKKKREKVIQSDLKGKKTDADPEEEQKARARRRK